MIDTTDLQHRPMARGIPLSEDQILAIRTAAIDAGNISAAVCGMARAWLDAKTPARDPGGDIRQTLSLPGSLWAEVDAAAAKLGISRSAAVRSAVEYCRQR